MEGSELYQKIKGLIVRDAYLDTDWCFKDPITPAARLRVLDLRLLSYTEFVNILYHAPELGERILAQGGLKPGASWPEIEALGALSKHTVRLVLRGVLSFGRARLLKKRPPFFI